MPRSTFFNLPEEKRTRVIEAALEEFSQYNYYQASITGIVEKADIAKGSFYQYFADKKDLYKYLIELIIEKKMDFLEDILEERDQYSFFQFLRMIYRSGIEFAREHPRLQAIGLKIYQDSDHRLSRMVWQDQKQQSINFFRSLLEKGIKEGELDKNIDTELTAHILTNLNIMLGEFIYEDGVVDMKDMDVIKKMLYIIENGIKRRE